MVVKCALGSNLDKCVCRGRGLGCEHPPPEQQCSHPGLPDHIPKAWAAEIYSSGLPSAGCCPSLEPRRISLPHSQPAPSSSPVKVSSFWFLGSEMWPQEIRKWKLHELSLEPLPSMPAAKMKDHCSVPAGLGFLLFYTGSHLLCLQAQTFIFPVFCWDLQNPKLF